MTILTALLLPGCGETKSKSKANEAAGVEEADPPFYRIVSHTRDANGCSDRGPAVTGGPAFVTSERGEGLIGPWVTLFTCADRTKKSCTEATEWTFRAEKPAGRMEEEIKMLGASEENGAWECSVRHTFIEATIAPTSLRVDQRDYEVAFGVDHEDLCTWEVYEAHRSGSRCVSRTMLVGER